MYRLSHLAGEAVAHPVDGLDRPGLFARDAQGLAHFHDALRDHRFRDKVVAPHVLQQLVLAGHPPLKFEQVQDEIERATFNLLRDPVPQKLSRVASNDAICEVVFLPPGAAFFRHFGFLVDDSPCHVSTSSSFEATGSKVLCACSLLRALHWPKERACSGLVVFRLTKCKYLLFCSRLYRTLVALAPSVCRPRSWPLSSAFPAIAPATHVLSLQVGRGDGAAGGATWLAATVRWRSRCISGTRCAT